MQPIQKGEREDPVDFRFSNKISANQLTSNCCSDIYAVYLLVEVKLTLVAASSDGIKLTHS